MARKKLSRAEAHAGKDITTELPPEILLFNILPRLPVKSVRRFTCVSKQWHSFLTSLAFVNMHRRRETTHKMVAFSTTRAPYTFHTIDCERPNDGFTAGRRLPFKVGSGRCIMILTSVDGLVCIGITKTVPYIATAMDVYSDLILWNPTTGDYKKLCKPLGFYHSDEDDDYKLLRVTWHPKVYIYSLKSDSWRKVESDLERTRFSNSERLSYFWGPSFSLNENLYFLEEVSNYSFSIMRFNKKTETLKVIATPFLGSDDDHRIEWLSFTSVGDGCIDLWVNVEDPLSSRCKNELWRMEGDGEWTKVGEFLCGYLGCHHRLHLMRSGNLVMYDSLRGCVFQLDMKTFTKKFCAYTTEKMRIWQGGKYIETMVSPNQYVK